MKKAISLLLCLCFCLSFCILSGCGYEYKELNLRGTYSREFEGSVLNVYNWGEYISDGSDDSIDVNKEFEKLTGIKVNYATFESNETMYAQLANGGVSYDLIIPSDYMIQRMLNENMLLPLETERLQNFDLIDNQYKGLFFDPSNEYTVAYNVGLVGIIYNTEMVKNPPTGWSSFWNKEYKNNMLMFSNPRDAFLSAQFYGNLDVNSPNKQDWAKAAELLKQQKPLLQSYVMDEVYGKMETGEAAIAPYYVGDFLTMLDVNPDLDFVYPEEGTNIFVDAICIPKCCKNYNAAMMYIDFLLEPDIALANAEYIGYASPNTAVINNESYCYYNNEYLYPDESYLQKAVYYRDIDPEIRRYYEDLWIDVKLY